MSHKFNEPAKCNIVLADVDGSMLQKYNSDDDDVYIGVGKVTIEDPDGTDIFYGRILRAVGNQAERTVTLECKDWLDQLDDELTTYDMREKLGTTDLRQSTGRSDVDNTRQDLRHVAPHTLWSAQADDGGAITDETTAANDLTDDDMTLLPAVPAVNDAYYFGFETEVLEFMMYISQQGDWAGTLAWEYWDGDSWEDILKGDAANAKWLFEVAPGEYTYAFTIPGDPWATVAVNGITAYWVRARVTVYTGITTQPLGRNAWAEYYFYDDGAYNDDGGMAFANDAYNGWKMFFTTEMAGTRTWRFYPYIGVDAGGPPTYADHWEFVWTNDDNHDRIFDGADWTLVYKMAAEVGNNTPSDFYVHDSISAATLHIKYKVATTGAGNHVHLSIYDNNAVAYVELHHLEEDEIEHEDSFTIPVDILPYIVNSDGEILLEFDGDRLGGSCDLFIKYCWIDVTTETTGMSAGITIDDTQNPSRFQLSTDLSAAATKVWEGIPYCVAKPIYLHLESATGPILGGDSVVTLTAAAGDIENTTGYSTTQFKNKSRLDILKALARQDKSMFYIAPGTATVTSVQTFGADTAQLTDGDVESWQSIYDYDTMYNSFDVYGARIGDYEIFQQATDATSIAKYRVSRSKIIKNAGLVSDTEALALGTALAASDSEIQQMVSCRIKGNTAHAAHPLLPITLATIVEITSSYLWSTAAKDYIVAGWTYNSKEHMTTLLLHPKVSIGLQEIRTSLTETETMNTTTKRQDADGYVPDPLTHEVS